MQYEIFGTSGTRKIVEADSLKISNGGVILQNEDGTVEGWINPGAVAFVVKYEAPSGLVVPK